VLYKQILNNKQTRNELKTVGARRVCFDTSKLIKGVFSVWLIAVQLLSEIEGSRIGMLKQN
jgi:hypothetical protein